MSKRTPGLPQRPNGFWPTPKSAIAPLVPWLPRRAAYGEPCAGDGAIVAGLADLWPGGCCVWQSDLAPQARGIEALRVDEITAQRAGRVDLWITNPPWPKGGKRGDPALSIIAHLAAIAPVWALLPWDFSANDYLRRLHGICSDAIPIGRVSWMGNGQPGKDNCGWFRFDQGWTLGAPLLRKRGVAA